MSIKLIVCDLDGTLMGPDLVFSPRLLRAVEQAQAQGVAVAIATGRGFMSALKFARRLGVATPLVCYQGALVRTQAGETWHYRPLARQFLPLLVDFCRRGGWELTMYGDDVVYYTAQRNDPDYYERWFDLPSCQVPDLLSAMPDDPLKLITIVPTRQDGDRVEAQLRDLAQGQFQVTRSHEWFVESLHLSVSKADGAARLADHLHIQPAEVLALGDNGNDAAMIEWAGLGVAVGNATDSVKAVADVVAPPQWEDGAAWAIEEFVLGGRR